MNEPNEGPRRYKWPRFVLAGVVLFIVVSVIWVAFAAKKVEEQRDYNAPIPTTAPAH